MALNSVKEFRNHPAFADLMAKLDSKMQYAIKRAKEVDFILYSEADGQLQPTEIGWWTNGFWPASMWQMFLLTGSEVYREEAIRAEKMLDAALANFKRMDHDAGFMWLIHSAVRYQLEKNTDSFDRVLYAADMLASRFNPNGFIRAWNGAGKEGWAIVDSMMNLPLLYWASRQTGDPRYRLMAMKHADTTIKTFVRPDGSCNHIVIFDPESGRFLDNPGGQGYASGSSWSRGQSWALYGFTLSYLQTGKQDYLDTAKRVADRFIDQCSGDYLPRCDFAQPATPLLRDNAAGNIAACGLLELAGLVPEGDAGRYFRAAVNILKAQMEDAANWEKDSPFIFTKCTVAYHDLGGRHVPMDYADYFFIEAIAKLNGGSLLFWYPDRNDAK